MTMMVTMGTTETTTTGPTMTDASSARSATGSSAPRGILSPHRFATLSLRRRIVGSVALLSALGLLGAGTAVFIVGRERIEDRVERLLAQEIAEFRELASTGIDPDTGKAFTTAERLLEVSMQRNVPDNHETHVGFLADVTIVPVDGANDVATDREFRTSVTRHTQPAFGEIELDDVGTVTYAVLPFTKEGRVSHYVATYFTDREMGDLRDMIRSYAIAAALAWAALVVAAWLLAGRILRPVHELRDTAAQISDSDLNRRIDVRGDDELSALGRTFNGMLDRLQEALGSQRRMLDDAGHELRTPITVVRGNLELMDADDPADVENVREIALDELDRMSGLVEDLLVLAKARLPEFLSPEPTDIGDLVGRIHEKAQALGPRTWRVEPGPPVVAVVDPKRITQAMLQLASNAVTVTGDGDEITVGHSATPTGVQVWVRDAGPGVPPGDRLRVFDRWQNGAQTPHEGSGTGLGLAIVKAIATAHGGTAWVTAAGAGGGALFIIEVPTGDLADEQDDEAAAADYVPVEDIFDLTPQEGAKP